MKIDRKGITRIVFIFDKFVIKIPNFLHQHDHFLIGCVANWSERCVTKIFSKMDDKTLIWKVVPTLWCSWFGLIQVQAKCEPKLEDLTDEEIEFYRDFCGTDSKKENFGWYKGRLVCLDYGQQWW